MVESDGITKPVRGEPGSGEAAQALRAILQTQYLRYLIISSWAVGLLAVVGPFAAALWFFGTIAAGALRGAVEKRISQRVGTGWGLIFPAVATATTSAWAASPEPGSPLTGLVIPSDSTMRAHLPDNPGRTLWARF